MIDQDKPLKFRDPKTGEVFEDITDYVWRQAGCKNSCPEQCAIGRKATAERMPCAAYVRSHPAEAARLMGYEVVKENSENLKIPRICEVLGGKDNPLEVGEWFTFPGMAGEFHITERGTLVGVDAGEEHHFMCASTLINHPDRIIRRPRFTEDEMATIRVLLAGGVTHLIREMNGRLRACEGSPEREPVTINNVSIGRVWKEKGHGMADKCFPTILPGQSVALADYI